MSEKTTKMNRAAYDKLLAYAQAEESVTQFSKYDPSAFEAHFKSLGYEQEKHRNVAGFLDALRRDALELAKPKKESKA